MNLFDGLRKIPQKEVANFIADTETYTLKKDLLKSLEYIKYYISMIIHLLAKLLHKEYTVIKPSTLQEDRCTVLYQYKIEKFSELFDKTKRIIKKQAGIGLWRNGLDEEAVSLAATKKAQKLYNYNEIAGMSLSEINEYIYKTYPKRKEKETIKTIARWRRISFLLIVLEIAYLYLGLENSRGLSFYIWAAFEIMAFVLCTRKVKQINLSRFIWLSISGSGGKILPDGMVFPSQTLDENTKKEKANDIIAIQSLQNILATINQTHHKNENEIQAFQDEINTNNILINQLHQEANEVEAKRIIHDKQVENKRLQNEIKRLLLDNEQKLKDGKHIKTILEAPLNKAVSELTELWKKYFHTIDFTTRAMYQIVSYTLFQGNKKI